MKKKQRQTSGKKPNRIWLSAAGLAVLVMLSGMAVFAEGRIMDQVLLEEEDCRIMLVREDPEGENGYVWTLQIRNHSGKELEISMEDTSVNGYVCEPYWSVTVPDGEETEETVEWDRSDLEECGISGVIREIETVLHLAEVKAEGTGETETESSAEAEADTESLQKTEDKSLPETETGEEKPEEGSEAEPDRTILKKKVRVSLQKGNASKGSGKDTSGALTELPEGGQILADTEDFLFAAARTVPDGEHGAVITVLLENRTDRKLLFSLDEVTVNEKDCDPLWAATVPAGKRKRTCFYWEEELLKNAGIDVLESMEGILTVYDADSEDSLPVYEEAVQME